MQIILFYSVNIHSKIVDTNIQAFDATEVVEYVNI